MLLHHKTFILVVVVFFSVHQKRLPIVIEHKRHLLTSNGNCFWVAQHIQLCKYALVSCATPFSIHIICHFLKMSALEFETLCG